MEQPGQDNLDGSSIKPVSSLRSHFESMAGSKPDTSLTTSRAESPPLRTQPDNLKRTTEVNGGRTSLDSTRHDPSWTSAGRVEERPSRAELAPPGQPSSRGLSPAAPPRPRPLSMGPTSPPTQGPAVTVEAPTSPLKPSDSSLASIAAQLNPITGSNSSTVSQPSETPSVPRLSEHHPKLPTRPGAGQVDFSKSPFLSATEADELPRGLHSLVPGASPSASARSPSPAKNRSLPPPVNRADKPKPRNASPAMQTKPTEGSLPSLAPTPTPSEVRVSPFSTPPSSDESSKGEDSPGFPGGRTTHNMGVTSPQGSPRYGVFERPPIHHSAIEKRRQHDTRTSSYSQKPSTGKPDAPQHRATARDHQEHRPGLPPRPPTEHSDDSDPHARSVAASPSVPSRPATRSSQPPSQTMRSTTSYAPPPRRAIPSGTHQEANSKPMSRTQATERSAGVPIPSRDTPTPTNSLLESQWREQGAEAYALPYSSTDYPDSSQANRRRPCFKKGAQEIQTRYDTRLFCISGEYVCSTGLLTRAWDVLTGELVMSLSHGEGVKVASIAFKPAANLEEEGTRIWLGTNIGEILEVDIPTQSLIFTKANAHTRREVIRIYRHASDMWTLDDEGKLHVWPADETGSPNLKYSPQPFRVPRGHTFSLVNKGQLWLATGREIRVFHPSRDANAQFQVLSRPLSQNGVGDVTSGATIGSLPEKVFFGHADGKVTIYSQNDYSCLGIINVSLYKINSLSGVGDHLWAGFNTGMLYVYDTTSNPWKVKKDWHAHDDPVVSISGDRSSVWKMDRLQVASLGVDNCIRIWDGMLQDDWLETEMHSHDVEFCQFREIKALIMTWNAGASTPGSLRRDAQDDVFFRNLFQEIDPPDILVFGFQELVDLEDKKLTAKSFFKGAKRKDPYEQEHMSRQYREWRDFLTRSIEDYMPADQTYDLLYTSSMVGLFTCIFVRDQERDGIRDVNGSEVKRGMGGLHGNKGALIVRFTLDDTSLCFVNCHLAAGQTQTVQRNNDVAAILETSALPLERDASIRTDRYIGGGDGSMILDHEICILNGDLNYRIDTMGRDTVVNAVKTGNLNKLLERDQLLLSRRKNPGFRLRAFRESPIGFAPTYKYDVGTDQYDTSEKKRSPAWCDRVLYRGLGRIKAIDYRRHELRVSDHRPVTAAFKMRVKTISPKKRAMVWERGQRKLEEVKQRMATEAKIDFLVNICGFDSNDASRILRSRAPTQEASASEREKLSEVVTILQAQRP